MTEDTTERTVRTRFAPSPTGPLHIGGVRSALFGWLYARHHGGQFILRIEDTDQKRYVEGSVDYIMDSLRWLGMDWDEGPDVGGEYGPYVQSQRLDHYQKWANWLLEQGKAYKCFATPEELAEMNRQRKLRGEPPGYDRRYRNTPPQEVEKLEAQGRSYVIRFKMPLEGITKAHDLVQGDVGFENAKLQDIVLLKSDGFPTYHLAHVVDDHLMRISHVTRANEWLPSLPMHIQIWQAFGWEMPQFAHLPVLLNPNGNGKLSKRHESFSDNGQKVLVLALEYRDAGYLPQAVMNYLTNIGWNFGDDQEVFTTQEAIERFELSNVNPANSAFPVEKLDWLNGIYIRDLPVDELAAALRHPLEKAGLTVDDDKLKQLAPIVQTRIKTLNDVVDLAGFVFKDPEDFKAPEPSLLIQKKMDTEATIKLLEDSIVLIKQLEDFSHEAQYEAMKQLAKDLGVKNGQLFGSLRVAVTGQKVSTPTFETMEILGKDESLRRIEMAIAVLKNS